MPGVGKALYAVFQGGGRLFQAAGRKPEPQTSQTFLGGSGGLHKQGNDPHKPYNMPSHPPY